MVTLTRRPNRGGHNVNQARDDRLVTLWNSGLEATELAQKFGVTRARVYQILAAYAARQDAAEAAAVGE